jgi:RNA 3'-phosphate cyclase
MNFLHVDGSYGEGGGQILRIAASFSIIFGQPIHITKIRAGREVSGLRQQHIAILRILREISSGALEGDHIGSTEIFFSPGKIENRSLTFDLRTAASITLVLQAIIPAVSLSAASLEVEFVGGTDVPWSPTADYFEKVLLPAIRLIGIDLDFEVRRRGYYPKGGGIIKAKIHPCTKLKEIDLSKRSEDNDVLIVSRCGKLPKHVAERQASSAASKLREFGIEPRNITISLEETSSPGSSILVYTASDAFIGSDGIGAKGRTAESVGEMTAVVFGQEHKSGSTIDSHLADMLAPLLCLCREESKLLAPKITEHMKSGLYVARLFTNSNFSFQEQGDAQLISLTPK